MKNTLQILSQVVYQAIHSFARPQKAIFRDGILHELQLANHR